MCQSEIMGDLSPGPKGVCWTGPEGFRRGPPSCPVQGMHNDWQDLLKTYQFLIVLKQCSTTVGMICKVRGLKHYHNFLCLIKGKISFSLLLPSFIFTDYLKVIRPSLILLEPRTWMSDSYQLSPDPGDGWLVKMPLSLMLDYTWWQSSRWMSPLIYFSII